MRNLIFLTLASAALAGLIALSVARAEDLRLWEIYDNSLKQAKYIDLTHAFSPSIPVWPGFGHAQFRPTVAGAAIPGEVERGQEFTYAKDGFVASAYDLPTDQYGTQLDPPAHWDDTGRRSVICRRPTPSDLWSSSISMRRSLRIRDTTRPSTILWHGRRSTDASRRDPSL